MGGTPGAQNFSSANAPPHVTLLPIEAEWRYDASGVDLGQDWRTAAFDDRLWPSANAVFFRVEDYVPTTWVGEGNRTSPHNFGVSPETNHARGASPGEISGYIERSPVAWYGDDALGVIDLATEDLSAAVTWVQQGHGNPMFGYFQSGSYGHGGEPGGLYWGIDDLDLYLFSGLAGTSIAEKYVASLVAGVQTSSR